MSRLPLGCRTVPSGTGVPDGGGVPSSSVNSRTAAVERVVVGVVLALRERPGTGVLARPERAAHVPEQHFRTGRSRPVQQDARAVHHHGAQATG